MQRATNHPPGLRRLSEAVSRISIRREAIYLARALAEACVMTPWLAALAALYRPVTVLTVTSEVFVIIAGIVYLTRSMGALRLPVRAQRAATAGVILLVAAWTSYQLDLIPHRWPDRAWLLASLQSLTDLGNIAPPGLIAVLAIAFLCWRGLRLAQPSFNVGGASQGFHLGLLSFTFFLILSLSNLQLQENIIPCIIAFFFCQLLAIGLTRVEAIGDQPGGQRSPFGGWWVTLLTLNTSIVVGLASAVYGVIRGVGPERILGWIAPVLLIILIPFVIVISPLFALLGAILEPIMIMLLTLATKLNDLANLLHTLDAAQVEQPYERAPAVELALRALGCGKGTLVLALSILILVGILWAIRRSQASQAAQTEKRESVWSAAWWLARVQRRLGQRLRRIAGAASILSRLGLGGLFTALTIRRTYAQLQKLAARRGYPREPSHTPYEYLPALYECFPNCRADLERITEAYVGAHYGELPEHPQELAEIRAALERIQAKSEKQFLR